MDVDGLLLSSAVFFFIASLPAHPPSTPPSLVLLLSSPVTALTVWLHVKAGAFCGSVTNLPGKTETICSGSALRGDEGVNT